MITRDEKSAMQVHDYATYRTAVDSLNELFSDYTRLVRKASDQPIGSAAERATWAESDTAWKVYDAARRRAARGGTR